MFVWDLIEALPYGGLIVKDTTVSNLSKAKLFKIGNYFKRVIEIWSICNLIYIKVILVLICSIWWINTSCCSHRSCIGLSRNENYKMMKNVRWDSWLRVWFTRVSMNHVHPCLRAPCVPMKVMVLKKRKIYVGISHFSNTRVEGSFWSSICEIDFP